MAPNGCAVVGLDGHSFAQSSCCNVLHITGPLQIPHLIELGINAVELLPLFEYDELEFQRMYAGERGADLGRFGEEAAAPAASLVPDHVSTPCPSFSAATTLAST